eukprot:SAG11_NODE_32814_length_280_cov_1.751381_1_plen_45_part_10
MKITLKLRVIYSYICTPSPTTNYLPNFLQAVLLRRNCDPRRSTAP